MSTMIPLGSYGDITLNVTVTLNGALTLPGGSVYDLILMSPTGVPEILNLQIDENNNGSAIIPDGLFNEIGVWKYRLRCKSQTPGIIFGNEWGEIIVN